MAGGEKDLAAARQHFDRACKLRNAGACHAAATMARKGRGGKRDRAGAREHPDIPDFQAVFFLVCWGQALVDDPGSAGYPCTTVLTPTSSGREAVSLSLGASSAGRIIS